MSEREREVLARFNGRSATMLALLLGIVLLDAAGSLFAPASLSAQWPVQALCLAVIAFGLWIWRRADARRLEADLTLAAARDRAVRL
jgi:hypothetical protein